MKREREKKERGFFRKLFGAIGVIILIVLIAAVSLSAYILISMKRDPVVSRSIQDYMGSQPDASFRHLSFTEDGRMTQSYSEDDIGYFIGNYLESEDIDPGSFLDEVPVSDLELKGFDLQLQTGKSAVCVEGAWRGIRIVARVLMDIRTEGDSITVTPDAFEIAGIRIPVSLIDRLFKTDIASISMDYSPELALLREVSEITSGEGRLDFTGPMATDILDYTDLSENRIRVTRLCQKKYGLAAPVLDTQGDDPAVRYASLIPLITEDPDRYLEYLDQLFTLISATATRKIGIGYKNYKMALRWFPDFYEYDYTDPRTEAYDEYYVCFRFLKTITTKIASDYSSGRLSISGSGCTYDGRAFSFEDYFGSSFRIYRPFFGMEEGRMCAAKKSADAGSCPAMLLRGCDGYGFVVAVFGAEVYSILPLKEEEYQQYLSSETVPVILLSDAAQFIGG